MTEVMKMGARFAQDQYMGISVDLDSGVVLLHLEIGDTTGDFEFSLSDEND